MGSTIESDISPFARQPWPRKRIQATIGTIIVTAMRPNIAAGASVCRSLQLVPRAVSPQPAGRPSTTMPANIAMTIST